MSSHPGTERFTSGRLQGAVLVRPRQPSFRWRGAALFGLDVLTLSLLAAVLSGLRPDLAAGAWTVGLPAATLAMLTLLGHYADEAVRFPRAGEVCWIVGALAGLGFAWSVALLLFDPEAGRDDAIALLGWLSAAALLTGIDRQMVRMLAARRWPERMLVIGAGGVGLDLARRCERSGRARCVGFVDDDPLGPADDLGGLPVFAERDLATAIEVTAPTRLALAFSRSSSKEMLERIRSSTGGVLPISIVPRYFEVTPSHATLSDLGGLALLNVSEAQLSPVARIEKRMVDLVLASVVLLLSAPLMLVLAILIKLDSPGPVLFRQERVGRAGRVFRMWKFRTMVDGAEAARKEMAHLNEMPSPGPLFKMYRDPRITRIGRFLRRTSLDELPQLVNVLAGSMSLVGPRPFVTHEAAQITGWAAQRATLVPGITGPWQVHGRSDLSYEEMIRLDYLYLTNWSLAWDLRLLLRTIPVVLSGKGAR